VLIMTFFKDARNAMQILPLSVAFAGEHFMDY
jgi:hypothetical protein